MNSSHSASCKTIEEYYRAHLGDYRASGEKRPGGTRGRKINRRISSIVNTGR